jgi:hypothetical protein
VFNILLGEGSHPIFAREEIVQASTRSSSSLIDEHRRVVAIVDETPPVQAPGIYEIKLEEQYYFHVCVQYALWYLVCWFWKWLFLLKKFV